MFKKELCDTFHLIGNDVIIRSLAICVLLFSIILGLLFSVLAAVIVLLHYFLGFFVCWSVIKYQNKASVYLQRLASFYRGHISPRKNLGSLCGICNDTSCKRHPLNQSVTPWKDLYIDKQLNTAVEHFYNKIIKTFIISWYESFTDDVTFLNELRYCLRYTTATLVNKIIQVDIGNLIANKLIPCAIKHVDDYLYMEQIAELKNVNINDVAVEYLGKRLHVATRSRHNELDYLRHLTACLMPKIMPGEYLKCRNYFVIIREILSGWVLLPLMDVIADPNIINSLIILAITYKSKKGLNRSIEKTEQVEFLCNFVNNKVKPSSFSTDLKTIKKNTDLFYVFMKFLKKESSVHLLQFCLDVDDFNSKLLTPDLSKKQLENLHIEASKLYKNYLDAESANFIGCSNEIVCHYRQLLQGGVYNVAKLQTSEPLYQAYEYALSALENNWLPSFFHSNEFYSHICGTKVTADYIKPSISKSPIHSSPLKVRSRKYYESSSQGTVARISSGLVRIKGALKTNQPVEGALFPVDASNFENGAVEDIIIPECRSIFRDLSTWKVSVPSFQSGSKVLYNIVVQRIDLVREELLQRKEQDFYTLRAKLIEFHGENEISDSVLPSRRTPSNVEVRRIMYEEFLKKLLQKPALKGSDLLYTFLTCQTDFTMLVSTAVPVGDLGNIYQSVAYKLRKEKGQHLDSFMNTFLGSTGKPKKFDSIEIGDEIEVSLVESDPVLPKTFFKNIFKNNFNISVPILKQSSSSSFNPNGITESLFYLLKQIFKVPQSILRLYAAICCVGQQAVNSVCRLFIERKIKAGLSQGNLAYLLGLLEGVIFQPFVSSTQEELLERKARAFNELKNCIPFYLSSIFGKHFIDGLVRLLDILQNPLLNKQLTYNLLDLIITEVYPELDIEETTKK